MPEPALKILILSCGLRPESRSRILAHRARAILTARAIDLRFVDLRDLVLPEYEPGMAAQSVVVMQLIRELAWADGIVIATPIHNWAVNSMVKKVMEATGDDTGRKLRAWEDKVVTFLCTAAVPQAYLSWLPTANSLMLDYKCIINPHIVFAVQADFEADRLTNEAVGRRLERVLSIAAELIGALKGRKILSGDPDDI